MKKLLLLTLLFAQESSFVKFQPEVLNNFMYVYDGLQREIPMCLNGVKADGEYMVYEARIPYISEVTDSSATFDSADCKHLRYVGMAHNHFKGECRPSERDIVRFENDKNAEIEVIVCSDVSIEDMNIRYMVLHKSHIEEYKKRYGIR